jgi:hypothetical protein
MRDGVGMPPILMRAQVAAEIIRTDAIVPRAAIYDLLNVLSGFASNATACGACQMGNLSAREALERFAAATGISAEMAYKATQR